MKDRSGIALCATLVFGAVAGAQGPAKPPDPKTLVERWFAADAWSPSGQAERTRLLAEVESLPALDDKSARKWLAECAKSAARGTKLEKKAGRHMFWERPAERGLYLVAGETANPKGLLIAMHGGGAGSGEASSARDAFGSAGSGFDWLVLCPEVLEKTEHGWTDAGSEEFVLQLVEAALRTWKLDADKVFFAGHSMGGYGTWMLGAHHADRVAGLAASAGAPTPLSGPSGGVEDVIEGVIPSLRNVRIAIYQSDDDPNVPPIANRVAAKKLAQAQARWGGFPHEYWEVSGRGHDLPPGGTAALLAKIAKEQRVARPSKLVWQPALEWKTQFYWLYWAKPQLNAIVEAELDTAKNEVRITCDVEPKGLEVLLDAQLLDLTKDVVVRLGEREVFRGRPAASLAVILKTTHPADPALQFTCALPVVP